MMQKKPQPRDVRQKRTPNNSLLPRLILNRQNLIILLAGLVVITIGYILLSIGPWDNPLSRSVAPIILLFGYLVIFPIAIFYGGKKDRTKKTGSRAQND